MLERLKRAAITASIALLPYTVSAQSIDIDEQRAVNELACECSQTRKEQIFVYLPQEKSFSNITKKSTVVDAGMDVDKLERIAKRQPQRLTLYHCHFASLLALASFAQENKIPLDEAERYLPIVADTPSGSDLPYSMVITRYLDLISPSTQFKARILNLTTNNVVEYDIAALHDRLDLTKNVLGLTSDMHESLKHSIESMMDAYEDTRWKSRDRILYGVDLIEALHEHRVVRITHLKRAPL